MRAIFIKEFRQGRPLLVFSLLTGLLLPLLYAVLLRADPFYRVHRDIIDGAFHYLCLVVPPIIAFFAGCGLFAGEVDWGTAPLLFGLPVSRRRIWAAKVLAGLALTAVGSAVSLALVRLFLPSVFRVAPFSAYVPDLVLWTAFAFAVAVFCSSIARHANAALALAAILVGALVAGAIALWYYLDAPLLGYTELLDVALWCFATVAALLLGSALVVTRGELLQSRRIWAIAFSTLLVTIGLTVLFVSGAARWLTRYDRSAVEAAYASVDSPGSRFARLVTVAARIPWAREFGSGWMPTSESLRVMSYTATGESHRRNYGIILDLETGEEALVRRIGSDGSPSFHAAISADGRRVAVISRPLGLTWGTTSRYRHREEEWTLEVWDLASKKLLYSGILERPYDAYMMSWSPSGKYLVLPLARDPSTLYAMPPDGSSLTKLSPRFESWTWAADDDVIYGLGEDGVLYRAYPDARKSEVVVSLAERLTYRPDSGHSFPDLGHWLWEPSPDGRWLLIGEQFRIETENATDSDRGPHPREYALWAVRTDGSDIRKLGGTRAQKGAFKGRVGSGKWTADGATLYLAVYNEDLKSTNILRWTSSDVSPLPVITGLAGHVRLLARPDTDEIVIWRWRFGGPGKPWYEATEGAVLLLDGERQVRELASRGVTAELATLYYPVGFDTYGRLVLSPRGSELEMPGIRALDLDTGEVRQIYP